MSDLGEFHWKDRLVHVVHAPGTKVWHRCVVDTVCLYVLDSFQLWALLGGQSQGSLTLASVRFDWFLRKFPSQISDIHWISLFLPFGDGHIGHSQHLYCRYKPGTSGLCCFVSLLHKLGRTTQISNGTRFQRQKPRRIPYTGRVDPLSWLCMLSW
jgi:hypothetical protein